MEHPRSSKASIIPPAAPATNVVLVYQDLISQQRAMELWDRVAQLVGHDIARCASWSVGELGNPGLLGKAAAASIQAEVIVVAVGAAQKLPPDVCAWIDAWVPYRRQREGALMAVIGVSGQPAASSNHAQEYLREIARRGGLDFILQEHLAGKAPAPAVPRRTEP